MKTNNMNLPANCSKISKDEMLHIDGGSRRCRWCGRYRRGFYGPEPAELVYRQS